VTIERLARVNRTQAFLGALGVVLIGLFAPGWYGAIALFALVGGLLALLVRIGKAAHPGTLLIRLVILAGLLAIAIHKIT
jgi:hypothetical protein